MFELRSINLDSFDEFYNYLALYFPADERKSKEKEFKELSNPKFNPNFIYLNGLLVGFICYWEFNSFIFIEHFAIIEELRNKGIGTSFLKYFLENSEKTIVLEVERPELEVVGDKLLPKTFDLAYRRIKFYERLGFSVNYYDYLQPSYGDGLDAVAMYMCSYPKELTEVEYKIISGAMYYYVYDVTLV